MKKSTKKKSCLREVTYGLPVCEVEEIIGSFDNATYVDAGWIQVFVGWDDQGGEFIYGVCGKKSFLLGKCSEPGTVKRISKNNNEWVFAVDALPIGFISELKNPAKIVYAGIIVKFGHDHAGRDFLSVAMPGVKLEWLFRNPYSGCTAPWSAHPAFVMNNKAVINPKLTAIGNNHFSNQESTGELELDELLAALS